MTGSLTGSPAPARTAVLGVVLEANRARLNTIAVTFVSRGNEKIAEGEAYRIILDPSDDHSQKSSRPEKK